jgi:hypothetical protein
MNKTELLGLIRAEGKRFDTALAAWEPSEAVQPHTVGEWSVKDLLAHVAGWEGWLVDLLRLVAQGKTPDFPTFALTNDDIQRFNERVVAERQSDTWEQALAGRQRALEAILDALEALPEETLLDPRRLAWTAGSPLAAMVAACTYRHYREHLEHLAKEDTKLSKARLLAEIREGNALLEATLADLDEAQATQPGVGGDWSVKDTLAHILGWDQELVRWLQIFARGETPDLPLVDGAWDWGEIDRTNERFVASYQHLSWERVLADHRLAIEAVLETVQALPEQVLLDAQHVAWQGDRPLSELVLACTCRHYVGHIAQFAR